ncbi:MAG: hypothetical protein ACJ8E5_23960 [Xanthobacteraceae bacterium]|jgi:hypothetical protein
MRMERPCSCGQHRAMSDHKADLAADRRLHHRPEVKSLRRGREGQSKGRNNRDTIASSRIEDTLATSWSPGHSVPHIKRYIAREVFTLISNRQREINQGRIAA